MVFSDKDKVLIENIYLLKGYGPMKSLGSSLRKVEKGGLSVSAKCKLCLT